MPRDIHWQRDRVRDELIAAALEVERTSSDEALAKLRVAAREYRAANNTPELLS